MTAFNDEIRVRRRRDTSIDDEYWLRGDHADADCLPWWGDDPETPEQESRAGFEEKVADSDGLYGPANLPEDVDVLLDDTPHPGGSRWERLHAGEAYR